MRVLEISLAVEGRRLEIGQVDFVLIFCSYVRRIHFGDGRFLKPAEIVWSINFISIFGRTRKVLVNSTMDSQPLQWPWGAPRDGDLAVWKHGSVIVWIVAQYCRYKHQNARIRKVHLYRLPEGRAVGAWVSRSRV